MATGRGGTTGLAPCLAQVLRLLLLGSVFPTSKSKLQSSSESELKFGSSSDRNPCSCRSLRAVCFRPSRVLLTTSSRFGSPDSIAGCRSGTFASISSKSPYLLVISLIIFSVSEWIISRIVFASS
uniref:(northern house mosquito) hypothetical protein n=1 Tax=Culex pipiens TaxID=7175 RepID=A0A8D8GWM5_CULPI